MSKEKTISLNSASCGGVSDYIIGSTTDATTVVESSPTTTSRRPPLLTRIVQNFLLVWLDSNIDECNEDFRNSMTQLQRIVNTIYTFADVDQCVDFVTDIKDEKVFLIAYSDIGQQILPLIHAVSQIDSIYVFCKEESTDKRWAKEWPKVKGTFTQIALICQTLNRSVRQCDQNSISISFISSADTVNPNLNELDQSYMYTQLLKEILLDIKYHNKLSVKNMVTHFRENNSGNYGNSSTFDKFEQDYHLHLPIWWYTAEYFIYSILNRALRLNEIDTIMRMGFFVCDLHRNIEELYSKQTNDQDMRSLTVYRGQGLLKEDFEKMVKTKGGLMSFNNFLSTSTDRDVAFLFANSIQDSTDLIGILFEMTIDTSASSIPFANLDNVSQFSDQEKEILFSMHTIFRIGDIEKIYDNDRFWRVELAMTNDSDKELSALTNKIREETQEGSTGPYRLGKLLIKLGEYDKAKQLYELLLDLTSDDISKEHLYHQLGLIKSYNGDYLEAISFFEKSLEIHQRIHPPNTSDMANYYNSIGVVYNSMGEYPKALLFYKKALEIEQNLSPTDYLKLASVYNNIGLVYDNMENYSEAFGFYEKSLEINREMLPSNHSTLAISYNNISLISHKMGEYEKALSFYRKGLEICQRTLPLNHPDLATIYSNIGGVYENMGEYSKALSYCEKALKIRQIAYSPDHPDLAMSYNNIGLIHVTMGEYSKALLSHKKALEIREKALPSNHPDLAISHDNIGITYNMMGDYSKALISHKKALAISHTFITPNNMLLAIFYINNGNMYNNMGEYSEALSFYKKALEIHQNILPSNHPDLGISYNNVGVVYCGMKDYSKALSFFEQALEIYQRTLSPDHPNLAQSYGNIGTVYEKIGEYAKAASYHERSLEIQQKTLPPNHPDLANSYNSIGVAYENVSEYSKALLYHEKAFEIRQTTLPPNHPDLANSYNNIGSVYENMNEYSKALSFFERAVNIAEQSLPPNHYNLQLYRRRLEFLRNFK